MIHFSLKQNFFREIIVSSASYPPAAKSLQSCPTLCDPKNGSPPGSPVPGILQERTLEWVAISFSSYPPDPMQIHGLKYRKGSNCPGLSD